MKNYKAPVNLMNLYGASGSAKYKGPMGNILGETIEFQHNNDRANINADLLQIRVVDTTPKYMSAVRLLILQQDSGKIHLKEQKYKGSEIEYMKSSTNKRVVIFLVDDQGREVRSSNGSMVTEDVPVPFSCVDGCGGAWD